MADINAFNPDRDSDVVRTLRERNLLPSEPAYTDARTTTTKPTSTNKPENHRSDNYATVNPTGYWLLTMGDAAFVLTKFALQETGTFPLPSVPVPQIPFQYQFVRLNLNDPQNRALRLSELFVAGADLILNDLIAENVPINDSKFTNQTVSAPLSGGVLVYFLTYIDDSLDPIADILRARKGIDYTGTNPVLNAGYLAYFAAMGVASGQNLTHLRHVSTATYNYTDNYLPDYVITATGGYPDGVNEDAYKNDINELITMIQESGQDALSMSTYLAALKLKYGVDLSYDELAALVTLAQQDSEKINTANALDALPTAFNSLARAEETNLIFVVAFGAHLMINNMTDNEAAHIVMLAVPAMDMFMSVGQGEEIQDLAPTIITDVVAQLVGYGAAHFVGDDIDLRLDTVSALAQIGSALYMPETNAALIYANETYHTTDADGNPTGNPTIGGMHVMVSVIDGITNWNVTRMGGEHLKEFFEHKDQPEELIPLGIVAGAQVAETIQYGILMDPNTVPIRFQDEVPEHVNTDGNNEGKGKMWVPLGISWGTTALGLATPFILPPIVKFAEENIFKKTASNSGEPVLSDNERAFASAKENYEKLSRIENPTADQQAELQQALEEATTLAYKVAGEEQQRGNLLPLDLALFDKEQAQVNYDATRAKPDVTEAEMTAAAELLDSAEKEYFRLQSLSENSEKVALAQQKYDELYANNQEARDFKAAVVKYQKHCANPNSTYEDRQQAYTEAFAFVIDAGDREKMAETAKQLLPSLELVRSAQDFYTRMQAASDKEDAHNPDQKGKLAKETSAAKERLATAQERFLAKQVEVFAEDFSAAETSYAAQYQPELLAQAHADLKQAQERLATETRPLPDDKVKTLLANTSVNFGPFSGAAVSQPADSAMPGFANNMPGRFEAPRADVGIVLSGRFGGPRDR